MVVKRSSSTPSGVILSPNEYKKYIHLTQAANMHPFCLLPRPVMLLLAFHIHMVHEFSILEPLITFLVIRIFFLPLLLHHLYL